MVLRELRNHALEFLVVCTTAIAGGNVNAQPPRLYQTWPEQYQIKYSQGRGLEFDLSYFEPGNYLAIIVRKNQTCEIVGGIYGGFRLNNSKPGEQTPNDKQISSWCINIDGDYCIKVRDDCKCLHIGHSHLDAGDILKFYKLNEVIPIEYPLIEPKDFSNNNSKIIPKRHVPTPADPRTRP